MRRLPLVFAAIASLLIPAPATQAAEPATSPATGPGRERDRVVPPARSRPTGRSPAGATTSSGRRRPPAGTFTAVSAAAGTPARSGPTGRSPAGATTPTARRPAGRRLQGGECWRRTTPARSGPTGRSPAGACDDERTWTIPPAGTFSAVSAGDLHTCAIRTDGTLACWGDDELRAGDAARRNLHRRERGQLRTPARSGPTGRSPAGATMRRPGDPAGRDLHRGERGRYGTPARSGPTGRSPAGATTTWASRRRPPVPSTRSAPARCTPARSGPTGRSPAGVDDERLGDAAPDAALKTLPTWLATTAVPLAGARRRRSRR